MKFTFFFKLPFTMYSIVWTVKTYWEPKLFYKFSTSVDHIFRSNLLSMFAEWPSFGTNSVKTGKMYFDSEYCYHYSKIAKLTTCGSIHPIVQISLQCYNNNDYKSENDLRWQFWHSPQIQNYFLKLHFITYYNFLTAFVSSTLST